jgi:regulator of protease activity HflC (stomatin/prohibitin superfamily)
MFDKLIDFILNQIENIIPCTIVFQFNNGVHYRFGKYLRTLPPGFYFKIPYLDKILQCNIVDTTILTPALSINKLVVRASVGYCIKDINKYYNKVFDSKSAISDISCVTLRLYCEVNQLHDMRHPDFGQYLKKLLQKEVTKYGIKVNFFEIVELTESRSYNDNKKS